MPEPAESILSIGDERNFSVYLSNPESRGKVGVNKKPAIWQVLVGE